MHASLSQMFSTREFRSSSLRWRGEVNVGRVDVLNLAVVVQDHTCVGVNAFQKHAGDV